MESFAHKALLQIKNLPNLQCVRFRRVNVQRPRKPHFEKAKVLAVCQPRYLIPNYGLSFAETCKREEELQLKNKKEENPFEVILAKECYNLFKSSKMIAFFHTNPITEQEKFKVRVMLKKYNMSLYEWGINIMKLALENTKYETVLPLFKAKTSMVFSPEPQLQPLLKTAKRVRQMTLLTCILEDQLLNRDEITKYSVIPDLTAAQAGLVATLDSGASQIVNSITHHQRTLVGHLQKHTELLQKADSQE